MTVVPPPSEVTVAQGPAPAVPGAATVPGYEIVELVGRGGMGKVYKARHRDLDRTVAIKVLLHEPDDKLLARFREETRAVAKLQHSNIAQLYESGTVDGRPFFSQEFVDGGTLAQKLAGKPMEPAAAVRLLATIARAIQHCHDHGILHRDLKPGNILLAADGTPKVTDFGLAKALPAPDSQESTATGGLTQTGDIVGTPAYMPPEQAGGVTANLGPAADVYALGAILYEMLTGRPPFQSPDALQTLLLVLTMDPVPPRTLLPKLPKDLDTICLKCLEKQPKKRYASAAALAEDLDRFLKNVPILARPVGMLERTAKWARRRKAVAALLASSVVFAIALGVAAVWLVISYAELNKANKDLETANTTLETTNTNLIAAKNESDRAYSLATTTLDEMVRDFGLKLNGLPQGEALMLEVIASSSDRYRALSEVRPWDAGVVSRHLQALAMRSAYETNYGRHEAAARTRGELNTLLARELAKWPDAVELRTLEIRLAFDVVSSAQAENKPAEAAAARAAYITLVDRFAKQFPAHPDVQQYQVRKHWFRGFDASARNDVDARIAALQDAIAAARQIPDPDSRFTFLSSSLLQQGIVLNMARRLSEADAAFAEAERVHEQTPEDRRNSEMIRSGLAEVRVKRAGIAMDDRRPEAALALYVAAEPSLRGLVRDFPLSRSHHLFLAECLFWQGVLLQRSDPPRCAKLADESLAVLDALLKRRPDPDDQATRANYAEMRKKLPPSEGK